MAKKAMTIYKKKFKLNNVQNDLSVTPKVLLPVVPMENNKCLVVPYFLSLNYYQ